MNLIFNLIKKLIDKFFKHDKYKPHKRYMRGRRQDEV
jgi:hypothetical protein